MAEDWDLYAVVRGCRSATSAAGISTTTTTTSRATTFSQDTYLSSLTPSPFKEENNPFSFPSLIQPRTNRFQKLHQLFIPFIATTTTTTTTNGCSIYPNSPFPGFVDAAGSINPALPASNIRPHFVLEAYTSGFERFHDHHVQQTQQQQQQQKHIQNQLQVLQQQQFQATGQISSNNNPATTLQNENKQAAQTPRSRKRKSQQKRMVCHVTAENLSADLWAWRKYGQKPIKGSPYPRNYYRCSSSKGCSARKQVERSNTDPDKFIVTYTGDHTHPRPAHRNTLAGSTRNKPSTTCQPTIHESRSPGNIAETASSSSFFPLSPRTPLTAETPNEECADGPMLSNEAISTDPDNELDIVSDDDILIPNKAAVMENIFLGAHHFNGGSVSSGGGGDSGSDNPADGSSPKSQPGLTLASQKQLSHLSRSSPS